MAARELAASEVGFPDHPQTAPAEGGFFALSSHKRAREALRFGLRARGIGFNVFVVGEDRSGRMTATLELLENNASHLPPCDDWAYLHNFDRPARPLPFRFPAGTGRRFKARMAGFAGGLRETSRDAALADVDAIAAEFGGDPGLDGWFAALRADLSEHFHGFAGAPQDTLDGPERRYAVNLLVDNGDEASAGVVLEPNPTYENLFGRIKYVPSNGILVTDFTLIRAGALHRANGGILVLRAEALAKDSQAWDFLKAALRDRKIPIEELHRSGTIPLATAPRPEPIPFAVKVVLVGAPRFYHGHFLADPEFRVYFKVKADICGDLRVRNENIAAFVGLIQRMAAAHGEARCDDGAVALLLGMASRWAEHREKFSSRLELLDDVISEAALIGGCPGGCTIGREHVARALEERRRRVGQAEDRHRRSIREGAIMVSTTGEAVGQVNGLIVFDKGDHAFGSPCRVTARSWIGARGVINVERDTGLGGAIQHKGVMGLQGYLAGTFARAAPVSFSSSVTFEQNYGGIEGDSASLAELVAILSDLSELPVRQDVAVTGSINQRGEAQPVGMINHKIEGFFRSCAALGDMTGRQGVVVPDGNRVNVVLHAEIRDAIADGRFHVWSVARAEEAVDLLFGLPAGILEGGAWTPGSVFAKVAARLAEFDRILSERERRPDGN